MQIVHSQYGKSAVGLLKVFREGDNQKVKEIEVSALATGDFSLVFREGDNSVTVPTDTMKNNVYAAAKELLGDSVEDFAIALADRLLERYPMFAGVNIAISEKPWTRLAFAGQPHDHAFQRGAGGIRTVTVRADRASHDIVCGIEDYEILKSTGSGFTGFPRCDLTSLAETEDRILATRMQATWHYSKRVPDFRATNALIVDRFLRVFAMEHSPAVQQTLFRMATVALETVPEVDRVSLRLPNLHFFPYDLARFGMENRNEVFYPAPDPHGDISATITR